MKQVLIVEDNYMNMELVIQLLEGEYHILTATDGAAGLDMALQHKPALTIMDLSLPVMDGWTAIREIRRNPATLQLPILALSAHAAQADIARALAAGANEYLTKPIDEDEFLQTVARLIQQS